MSDPENDPTTTDAPIAEVPPVETTPTPEPVAIPAPVEEAAPTIQAWEHELETWFNDLRHNLSDLETETHNKLFAAKEALKVKLAALFQKEA